LTVIFFCDYTYNMKRKQAGFTLIELLVVIGILAVLLAITLIAINPGRQFAQANNTKRRSDINAILNGITQYATDHNGSLPSGITTASQPISKAAADICASVVTQYLAALPVDPLTNNGSPVTDCTSNYDTGYTVIQIVPNKRVEITAPAAELGEVIQVTR